MFINIHIIVRLTRVFFPDIMIKICIKIREISDKDANKIQLTGYETYSRDINSDIYNIENIETFFMGEDGSLYVLFPYGNNKFTTEMDIVKF